MAVAEFGLPPGAYERDGKYYRKITLTGRDEKGEYVEYEEREVLLPIATDEASIAQSRERAAQKGLDFYDPRTVRPPNYVPGDFPGEVVGWLDRGRKREKDWAWNSEDFGKLRERHYKDAEAAASEPVSKEKVTTNGK